MNKFGVNIITPFTESNEIDFEALDKIIEKMKKSEVDRILLGSQCGEFESMTDEEIISLSKYVVDKMGENVSILVSTGFNDIKRTLLLTINMATIGVSGIVIKTPTIRTSEKGILNYFKTILQSSILPCYIESYTSEEFKVPVGMYKELSKIKSFSGVIESSMDIERYILTKVQIPGKELICGRDKMLLPALSIGYNGVISSVANIWLDEISAISKEAFEGNYEVAREMFLYMYGIIEMMEAEENPIPIKTTMNMLGHKVGEFRLPLSPMDPDKASNIIKMLMDMNQIEIG